ncbi:MAG: Tad domain-containing protein [Pseudomonadota bacterium]
MIFETIISNGFAHVRDLGRRANTAALIMFADVCGQIALSASLAFGGMVIMVAMVLNLNVNVSERQNLQAIADLTALALATEINILTQNDVDLDSVALARVNGVLSTRGRDTLSASEVSARTLRVAPIPNGMTSDDVDDDAVEVTIETTPTPSPALSALNANPKPVRVSSRALRLGSNNLCVIALEDAGDLTLHARDSARLTAPDCDIVSNSTNVEGVLLENAAKLTGNEIHSAGGASGPLVSYTPEPITDSLTLPDPLASLPEPELAECNGLASQPWSVTGLTLNPGVYCNGIRIDGSRDVTLLPGVYTLLGDFQIVGSASVVGDGITFHFLGDRSKFMATGNSVLRLTAPTTGPTAGILIFDGRAPGVPLSRADEILSGAAPASIIAKNLRFDRYNGKTHVISSNQARYMVGTIYLPQSAITFNASAAISDQSEYTAIVARQIRLYHFSNLFLNTNYDATDVPTPDGVGPSGGEVRLIQ